MNVKFMEAHLAILDLAISELRIVSKGSLKSNTLIQNIINDYDNRYALIKERNHEA